MVKTEGGKDDQGPGCFCFLARLRPLDARLAVGAAKASISGRLDQRRGLWGQTHKGPRRGLRAEMLAWRRLGGAPGMETPTSRLVADDDQGIWMVENPEEVRNFPAAHVMLAGEFDSAKKTIHVEKITPSAQ